MDAVEKEAYTNHAYLADGDDHSLRNDTNDGNTDYATETSSCTSKDEDLHETAQAPEPDTGYPSPDVDSDAQVKDAMEAHGRRRNVSHVGILNPAELMTMASKRTTMETSVSPAETSDVEYSDPPQKIRARSILRKSTKDPHQHPTHIHIIEEEKEPLPEPQDDPTPNFFSPLRSRQFSMMLSFAICLCLIIVCTALILNEVLGPSDSLTNDDEWFFTYMYTMGSAMVIAMLVAGISGHLTKDNHYKHRRKSAFIRGGMMVLGSGTVIYRILLFIEYVTQDSECLEGTELMLAIPGLFLICAELSFLLVFTKVRMNKSLPIILLGRYASMHMVATNVSVWLAVVVKESVHEIHLVSDDHHYSVHGNVSVLAGDSSTDTNSTEPYCPTSAVLDSFEPYIFPLIIEYSVMVSTMWLSLWDNVGAGYLRKSHRRSHSRVQRISSSVAGSQKPSVNSRSSVYSMISVTQGSGYRNSNVGLILGWLILIGSIVVTFVFLYLVHADDYLNEDLFVQVTYGFNIALSGISIIAIPLTAWGMSGLDTHHHDDAAQELANFHLDGEYHEEYHHNVDKGLMFITFLFLLVFKCLCIMSAFSEGGNLIILDGLVSIILGFMQTGFINGYAFNKVSTQDHQRRNKPGRQGLEFLRCTELALWLTNTFMLKNPLAKAVPYAAFGTTAWAILGNIFQPLTILHYFHCMTCVASVIGHAYSDKYTGNGGMGH